MRALSSPIIAAILTLFITSSCAACGFQVRVSRAELQKKVDARMPMKKNVMRGVVVKFDDAKINLKPGSDRLDMTLSAFVKAGAFPSVLAARIHLSSGVSYQTETGEFRAVSPRVERVDIRGVGGKFRGNIEQAVNLILPALSDIPLYQLKEGSQERYYLKNVDVNDGHVVLCLGL